MKVKYESFDGNLFNTEDRRNEYEDGLYYEFQMNLQEGMWSNGKLYNMEDINMKTKYEANDGKLFDTEIECRDYEDEIEYDSLLQPIYDGRFCQVYNVTGKNKVEFDKVLKYFEVEYYGYMPGEKDPPHILIFSNDHDTEWYGEDLLKVFQSVVGQNCTSLV